VKALLVVLAAAALLRLAPAVRQELWADELFSLAVATGHSLEHPADAAVPALGDFVEPPQAVAPDVFRRYLEHDTPPAGAGRVVRAVLLSDTSPPLYYLMLAGWTRLFGTGDLALHLCSVLWALATMPLLWLVGRRIAGPRVALLACILFALAPVGIYYAVEARMYALLWFLSTLTAWLTFRLHDRGGTGLLSLWCLVAAAGFLTHYFYAFVWAACVLWLVLRPGRCPRIAVAAAVVMTAALVFPWYRLLPDSLARWRVTGHWLDGLPPPADLLKAPIKLGWGLVSGHGQWRPPGWTDKAAAVLVLLAGVALLRRGRRAVLGQGRELVWLWVLAACVGPVVFDLSRGTFTSLINRYALAGFPAAMLLVALALSALRPRIAAGALALLVVLWTPGLVSVVGSRQHSGESYSDSARAVGLWSRPGDLVLVLSIPSGVLGVARYLEADLPMAAWVGQLGRRRVPDDIEALVAGRPRVAFVRVHDVGEPAPEEDWLRAHASLLGERRIGSASVAYFRLTPVRR
jgi:4-amino-4-deoxy-L-arabinose transferase-like glycosyltransferase